MCAAAVVHVKSLATKADVGPSGSKSAVGLTCWCLSSWSVGEASWWNTADPRRQASQKTFHIASARGIFVFAGRGLTCVFSSLYFLLAAAPPPAFPWPFPAPLLLMCPFLPSAVRAPQRGAQTHARVTDMCVVATSQTKRLYGVEGWGLQDRPGPTNTFIVFFFSQDSGLAYWQWNRVCVGT